MSEISDAVRAFMESQKPKPTEFEEPWFFAVHGTKHEDWLAQVQNYARVPTSVPLIAELPEPPKDDLRRVSLFMRLAGEHHEEREFGLPNIGGICDTENVDVSRHHLGLVIDAPMETPEQRAHVHVCLKQLAHLLVELKARAGSSYRGRDRLNFPRW